MPVFVGIEKELANIMMNQILTVCGILCVFFAVIGILMAADLAVFAYVSVLIHKFAKERKELEQQ